MCRYELGAKQHQGNHGLGGLDSLCPTARGNAGVGLCDLTAGSGGRVILPQHVSHDHHEQRLAQAGSPTAQRRP